MQVSQFLYMQLGHEFGGNAIITNGRVSNLLFLFLSKCIINPVDFSRTVYFLRL